VVRTYGITDDLNPPTNHVQPVSTLCLVDLIESAGKTWKVYAENYVGGVGGTTITDGDSTPYVEHHVPFAFYTDVRNSTTRCPNIQDFTNFSATTDFSTTSAATTPNFSFIAPNNNNNMHDGTVAAGDTWLSNNVPLITASKAWTSRKCVLIVVWDEDAGTLLFPSGNQVVCVLQGSQGVVKTNATSGVYHDHYGLCATIQWLLDCSSTLGQSDMTGAVISEAFN